MIFQDPDTLRLWIDIFLAFATASVAFAFVVLAIGIRETRRPAPPASRPVEGRHLGAATAEPARRAA
jgi:hypothetical protein